MTSAQEPSIPVGYSRYYRTLTDDSNTFDRWHYAGNVNRCLGLMDSNVQLPSSINVNDTVHVRLGMIYKKINGELKEKASQADYIKKEQPEWKFIPSKVHDTGNSYRTYVIQGQGEQSANRQVYVGGYWNYSHSGSMKNAGKRPIKNTKISLKQPTTGSGKINFKEIKVSSHIDSGAEKGQLKVELEIKNALTNEIRTVDGGSGNRVTVSLPNLQANEYINQVIVTPMGTDGNSEGDFASKNSIVMTYVAKSWETNHWPDGTDIPLNDSTHVNMSWSMDYLDETEGKEPSQTTLQGNTYPIYYVPAQTTEVKTAFVSSNAQGRKPGEYVDYEIRGYNQFNAIGNWVNPEIGVAIPKVLELQEPTALKTFVDEKNSTTYDNSVKVTLVSSDDTYNYYKFNVTGTAYKNDFQSSFSIPLRLKVKEGTPQGTYKIPYATASNNIPSFVQLTTPTNNLDSNVANAFGYDNNEVSSYSGFTGGHTDLTVVYATKLDGSTAGRENSNDIWSNLTNFAVEKGGRPQMKATISNTGNTAFESVRLYNILPSTQDGRGSTGNISFTGLENVNGATVYYTTKPVSELPQYDTNLQEWDNQKLTDLGFTTVAPINLSTVTAIYIDFGNKKVLPPETMDTVLNFLVPNANNQKAINQFQYSAKEEGSGTALNAKSDLIIFSTEVAQVNFEENLPYFLAQGGDSANNMPTSQSELLDVDGTGEITVPDNIPTLEGYDFVHWVDEIGNTYNPSDVIQFTRDNPKTTITLKAVWRAKKVNVIYNENFGDSARETTKEYSFGDTVQLSDVAIPTRAGYTFKGWSESNVATSPDFLENSKIDFVNTKTVYAIWGANTYTIKFDADGGDGTMPDQAMTYDVEQVLSANTFTKEGYTFKGWNVKTKGIMSILKRMTKSVTYTDGQSVKNLTDQADGEITLVAVWEANDYAIKFDANGGTGTMPDQAMKYDQAENLTKNAYTKEEYTFKGWATTPDGNVVYADEVEVKNLTNKANESITLYAVWEINSYDVTFDSQGGNSVDGQNVEYNALVEKPTNPTREGYTFGGWYKEAECTTVWDFDTDKMTASNLTLYAKWILNASELNYAPTINATDKVLTVGDTFNPLDEVTAHDTEDGDIALTEANIIANNVDMSQAGTYSIIYKVTDSKGASVVKTITVVVNPKLEGLNHIPIINVTDKVLTVGDTFNPLDGVTAHDTEDGDITLTEANIIANNVDMSKAGTYSITYKVTDSKGASTVKTITVTVNEKATIPVEKPDNTTTSKPDKLPQTGDVSNLGLLGLIFAGSGGMLLGLNRKNKLDVGRKK
ncbi:InlB B-repeat-containing protein (plasmid) [Clostridium perfringens]